MQHTDVINIVSVNPNKFQEVYEDLGNLETSCDLIADAHPEELNHYIKVMISSLLKFKTSKFELVSETICSSQNCGSHTTVSPANLDITSEQQK